MAIENLVVVLLSFCLLGAFHAGHLMKVNAEEVPDPVRMTNHLIDSAPDKRFDSFTNGFGEAKRSFDEIGRSSFGFNKRRDFDEIGRSSFGFNKRRDFDEIGRSSFGFNKRRDFDEIGRSSFGFNKRRNFDEIGRSSFGFNKRQQLKDSDEIDDANELNLMKRGNFDEIGRSSFGFYRRSPVNSRSQGWRFFSGFGKRNAFPDYSNTEPDDVATDLAKKRSFDEINRSSFGFSRR